MDDRSHNLNEYVQHVRRKLRMDADNVVIIGGLEGSGKSMFGLLLCNAISPESFDIKKHVAYEPEEFISSINKAPKYGSIDADEGGETFMAGDAMTTEGKNIKKCLQQCRRKNLNLTILAPRHFYLNKMSLFRCHTFFYIFTKGSKRGYGIKYDPVIQVWQEGKRPWFDKKFYFTFPDLKAIDKDAYDYYIEMKNKRADARLERYAEECKAEVEVEKEPMTPELLSQKIRAIDDNDPSALRNATSRFDCDKIYHRLKKEGATVRLSKAVASDLNMNYA